MRLKKYILSIVAMAFVGLGTYQAYGSYAFSESSPKSQLLAENIEALSENDDRETSYIRTDGNCEYKVSGSANGYLDLYLAGIKVAKLKLGADGTASYTYEGKTDCAADGKQMCSPRYCPQLSYFASK